MSQYSQNPFYGGGGGFMAESPYGGSGGGSPGGAKRYDVDHSLRPVTIKQLLNAPQVQGSEGSFEIGGKDIANVTIVGHVISAAVQTTNDVYWLDDGTGKIEARHWKDSSIEGTNDIGEHTYIRVIGNLKQFGNKRYINAQRLQPIKDEQEVFFHILESMSVTLMFERGPPSRPGQKAIQNHGIQNTSVSAYSAQSSGGQVSGSRYSHLPPLQQQILNTILQEQRDDDGVHVANIARSIKGGDAQTISAALDSLMDDGHVYTTIDDSHFAVSM